jgi:DNA-binding NarL/FixJ family response regulator
MNTDRRRSLLFVEDDPRLQRVVASLLCASAFEVTFASDGREAEAALERFEPALALVDLGLPDIGGAELIRRIRARRPATSILVVTVISTEAHILEALRAGASGYLYKEDLGTRLVGAIDEALAGGAPISRDVARVLVEHLQRNDATRDETGAPTRDLTERELDVLERFARGERYEDVARSLHVSVNTVRTHVRGIYEKLEVASKTQAVVVATRLGLFERGHRRHREP